MNVTVKGFELFYRECNNKCTKMTLSAGPKARLMLRYPDGQREQIALSAKAKLMVGKAFHDFFIVHRCQY